MLLARWGLEKNQKKKKKFIFIVYKRKKTFKCPVQFLARTTPITEERNGCQSSIK